MVHGLFYSARAIFHVLERENKNRGIKICFFDRQWLAHIAEKKGCLRGLFFGCIEKSFGTVNAHVFDPFGDVASEYAASATEIQERGAGFELQKPDGIWQDHCLVIMVPFFPHKISVPLF